MHETYRMSVSRERSLREFFAMVAEQEDKIVYGEDHGA